MEGTNNEELRRHNNGIFLFKENQIRGFTDSDSLNSLSSSNGKLQEQGKYERSISIDNDTVIKHTILSDFYDSEDNSLDEDYNPLLSSDTEDNENTIEDVENAQTSMAVDREATPDFIYEFDTDDYEDFDNTQYEFEPIKQRQEFYKLSLNSLPYIILVFFTLLLSYNTIKLISVRSIPSYDSRPNSDTMLNHKLLILNAQVNQLMQMQSEISDLRAQLNLLSQSQYQHQMNNSTISTITMTKDIGNKQIKEILGKLNDLEAKINKGANTEVIQLPQKVQDVKRQPSTEHDDNANGKSFDKGTPKKTMKPFNPFVKYFNIANQGEVDVSLTTLPLFQYEKIRKSIISKVIHGYADLVRRVKLKMFSKSSTSNWWQVITGKVNQPAYNLNVTNSPLNVLKEEEGFQWVNKVNDLPVYLTLKFNKGVKLKELGLYQNLYGHNIKANVRMISVFVQPTENIEALKKVVKKEVNQDINFSKFGKELKKWVRLGEMEYNIHLDQCYQNFPFKYKLIDNWPIQKIMIIVHSNWGDPEKVIFDTLRVYENSSIGLGQVNSRIGEATDDSVPFL